MPDHILDQMMAANERRLDRAAQLEPKLKRLLWIAEHLFQMIPQQVWRDSGGDDGQGHYEGDYHAEQLQQELKELREFVGPHDR